jgi:hypothetical protein
MIVAAISFIPDDCVNENGTNENAAYGNKQTNVFHWIWFHQKTKKITFIVSRHFNKIICHFFFFAAVYGLELCFSSQTTVRTGKNQ